MKIKVAALILASFLLGAVVMTIPKVANTVTNLVRYVLDGDDHFVLQGGGMRIAWSDAEELFVKGQVRSIFIPHSGQVTMVVHSGLRFQSREPYSGAANEALKQAPNRRWISVAIE